jgi:hypothetical protein
VGTETVDLFFGLGTNGQRTVEIQSGVNSDIKLASSIDGATQNGDRIDMRRSSVEVGPIFDSPVPGSRTLSARVLQEANDERRITMTLEGIAGSDVRLNYLVRDSRLKLNVTGAELNDERHYTSRGQAVLPTMTVHFPPGEGWKTVTVTLTW